MSTKFPTSLVIRRQKEANRPDRAYVTIDGRRVLLGAYGSPESYKKLADVIEGKRKVEKPIVAPAAPTAPTVSMLMAQYLEYAIGKYNAGETASEVVHTKLAFRILRETHGAILAKDFGPKAYKVMRLSMIEAGWSRRYIRDQCQRIKRLIEWA